LGLPAFHTGLKLTGLLPLWSSGVRWALVADGRRWCSAGGPVVKWLTVMAYLATGVWRHGIGAMSNERGQAEQMKAATAGSGINACLLREAA